VSILSADKIYDYFRLMIYMRLMLVLITLAISSQANAFRYLTSLEDSDWETEASPYACALKHMIEGYGYGVFVHEAGEKRVFQLNGHGFGFANKPIQLISDPPNWLPNRDQTLLSVLGLKKDRVEVRGELITQMMAELVSGMLVSFNGILADSENQTFDIVLSAAGFHEAYEQYLLCEQKLLPVNFRQVERTRIQYQSAETDFSSGDQRQLDNIAVYLMTDKSIRSIYVDGYTDDAGLKRDNVTVSKIRAELVTNYLLDKGVSKEMIVTRYHGESYPVVKNTANRNRAKNRRTTVRLSREEPVVVMNKPEEPPVSAEMMEPMSEYNTGELIDAEQLVKDKQAMSDIGNSN
jgi:outer membrane protein OmpA-like peptidoglycan-associated protein